MKLNELNFEPRQVKQTNAVEYRGAIHNAAAKRNMRAQREVDAWKDKDPSKINYLGSGAYGTAYNLPRKTNTVVKIGNVEGNRVGTDGYLTFIKFVKAAQDEGQSNPYLPQIHDVKMLKDRIGRVFYKVRMEKLDPLPYFSEKQEDLWPIWQKILHTDQEGAMEYVSKHRSVAHPMLSLLQLINDGIENPRSPKMKQIDPQLKAAMILINKAMHASKTETDIGPHNVMIRRTPYGPQLVVLDPLA
ncbi:hypothetical protein E4H12_01875 [Candidatus Thorarchaeota archaeon]|nr:MAG: hypothetical protein E4H12_01875 [Candidatus Thorarchaeota archaeon]